MAPIPPHAEPGAGGVVPSIEAVVVESCDGARLQVAQDPQMLRCDRWVVEWREGGTPWGIVRASSHAAVLAERARQLGFARRYARFFEQPIDERYADPSAPICNTCNIGASTGRWGDGQKFGDGAARPAITTAGVDLEALEQTLAEHMPRLEDAARLARESLTGRVARAYAKQLRQAVLYMAKGRLTLENAEVFRSAKVATSVSEAAKRHVAQLSTMHRELLVAVGKAVANSHAGKYLESGFEGADRPYLQVEVDGSTVTATYYAGGGESKWFEGTVALDGAITGRSLVAPDPGKPVCQQHTEACGYVYIPSVLRFTQSQESEKNRHETAELWFQRSQWVMAKPFIR